MQGGHKVVFHLDGDLWGVGPCLSLLCTCQPIPPVFGCGGGDGKGMMGWVKSLSQIVSDASGIRIHPSKQTQPLGGGILIPEASLTILILNLEDT